MSNSGQRRKNILLDFLWEKEPSMLWGTTDRNKGRKKGGTSKDGRGGKKGEPYPGEKKKGPELKKGAKGLFPL